MKKPIITIEDGCFKVNFDLTEEFNPNNMAEKYGNLQDFIDLVYKPDDQEYPNDTDSA